VTPTGVDWYEAEPLTRRGLVTELQRIWRRIRVRPWPMLLVAALVTTVITRRIATKQPTLEAYVVLALTEGAFASPHSGIPVIELRQYVTEILLPNYELTKLIERRDLFRLRKIAGPQFAIEQLRDSLSVQIWKNTFVYYDEADSDAAHSARIGLSVTDTDPERAFAVARDLASIVMRTAAARRQFAAKELEEKIATLRKSLTDRLAEIAAAKVQNQAALAAAERSGHPELTDGHLAVLIDLAKDQRSVEQQLARIDASPENIAREIAAAGLDVSLTIVDEHRPERHDRSTFVLVLVAAVVGACALVGAALVFGAFDSRVHDADDVARLGLPVLGHVPGFAGDKVGSMQTRSAQRGRVPSSLGWRSHR
jgi:uncharacterized protein involved in exopolysaccharide biosynthesis